MLENIRGHSRGSIPPLRLPSLLPHDLCHEWNVSRRLPADTDDSWGRTGVCTCEHKEQGKEWPEAKLNERKEEIFYFSSQRVYISF